MSPSNDLRCRGCAAPLPAPFLDLGRTPLANAYLKETDLDRPEPTFPLATAFCGSCHLVQLTHVVPPEQLFTEYLYFSSYSTSFLEHARRMAAELTEAYALGPKSKVLEIASNDGYLLRYFQERGIEVLGIEPARNIAFEAERSGVPTLNRFFGPGAVA
ncbi:MAG: methyltransferase, partial [Polyangiaceae bacterium]|nr:methyltransferase [Polyangiaceae bacterium]